MIKSTEQIDFSETMERLKGTGLNQADVARELKVTRSAVSMILSGVRQPSPGTLFMLKDLERRMGADPERGESRTTRLDALYNKLALLELHDQDGFETARRVIDSLVPASSKPRSAAKRLLKKGAASALKSAPK